jgi:hypothetical protein
MSGNPFDAERRSSDRRPLRVRAEVLLPGDQRFEVRTTDISINGVGIVASANPQKGAVFDVQFSIPLKPTGSLALSARAQVIHSILSRDEGGFKIGLQFLSSDAQREAAIKSLLA